MLVNLTNHDIVVRVSSTEKVIKPSGMMIRLDEKRIEAEPIDGIPTCYKQWGSAHLPEQKEGVYYIVSSLVANAFPDRTDLVVPETKKDADGRTYAISLVRNSARK